MLAYLFWHRPYSSIGKTEYESALTQFHQRLAGQRCPGLRSSATFLIPAVPWLDGRSGYEDWYFLEGSAALEFAFILPRSQSLAVPDGWTALRVDHTPVEPA